MAVMWLNRISNMCTEYEVATPTIPPASQGMDAV